MKETSNAVIKKKLKPHRIAIDKIDDEILKLLSKRFGIVRKVAKIKIANNIPAFIGDRVEEVRNRATSRAKQYGINREFMHALYTLMIYESCATEDLIKLAEKRKKKK